MGSKVSDAWENAKRNPWETATTGGLNLAYKAATNNAKGTSQILPEIKDVNLFGKTDRLEGFQMPANLQEVEMQAIQRQAAIGAGAAPSIAEMQYRQAMDNMIESQRSAAASQRGVSNPALANREIAMQSARNQQELAREGAALRLGEQRQADDYIGRQAAAARGVAFQQSMANQQAAMADRNAKMSFLGNIGGAAATAYASDKNLKKDIKEGSALDKLDEFMNALKSYDYEYKDGMGLPSGEQTSVMAQDLEKSDLGSKMVFEGEKGKMVDYSEGLPLLFAAIAELNERTKGKNNGK